MASIFEQTIVPKINFSNFALNESQLLTCNFGQLIPCYCREVLPNDVFTLSAIADIQFAPMVAPMMQDVHASIHFFYVPNRIVWDDFETFITGSEDGHVISEDQLPTQPGFTLNEIYEDLFDQNSDYMQGSILDYLGLPNQCGEEPDGDSDVYNKTIISDIPLRDYFKIWYDYYRDENLQVDLNSTYNVTLFDFWRAWKGCSDLSKLDPPEHGTSMVVNFSEYTNYLQPLYRAYRKDYFTAALPTPQKGEPVTLSLGTTAPVTGSLSGNFKLNGIHNESTDRDLIHLNSDVFTAETHENLQVIGLAGGEKGALYGTTTGSFVNSIEGIAAGTNMTGLSADLSHASALTVEALREAFAVQEILESLSMRGSRFTEFLKGNFGVTPDDYRLQRPQFLGGIVTPVSVQQVLQQAGVDSDAGQLTGYAAGRAFAAAGDRVFRTRFKEHGYIIGILSVMPKAYYYQGIPRHFLRKDRFDYYMPQTAHLGEQGIENIELYYDPAGTNNHSVFGYIPRWAEYKTSTNGIHGDFRDNLNYYHMARVFNELPTLSDEFISTKNVQTRPWAVWQEQRPNVNHLIWANLYFKVTASRPMPYQSIPKIL